MTNRSFPFSALSLSLLLALALSPTIGHAQDADTDDDVDESSDRDTDGDGPGIVGDGRAAEEYPEPARPSSPDSEDDAIEHGPQLRVVDQAGVGSEIAYGRSGVVELGGFLSMTWTERAFAFDIAPTVGVFLFDNFQLSGIFGLRYINASDGAGVRTDSTAFTLLAEPSYHLPLADTVFFFGGVGLGVQYNGVDAGFAVAPRIGMNFLLGRSGILSPAIRATWIAPSSSAAPTLDVLVAYTIML